MSSIKRFDWYKLIAGVTDESFGIPPDVVFQIVENGQLVEIKAHRMILAMVSPYFKMMFYTTEVGDKNAKEVKIQETTAPAFQILMNAIYDTKSIEDSLRGKSVQEIFDVLYLIEQYQIDQLKETVQELLSNYPVTEDSVLEVAEEATEYTGLFQKEAHQVLLNCAKFIKSKLRDTESIFKYVSQNNDRKELVSTLLGLMSDLPPLKRFKSMTCSNCGNKECQDGQQVKKDEFRVGLIVTTNKVGGCWFDADRGTGKVTNVKSTKISVRSVTPGSQGRDLGFDDIFKKYGPDSKFLFFCK